VNRSVLSKAISFGGLLIVSTIIISFVWLGEDDFLTKLLCTSLFVAFLFMARDWRPLAMNLSSIFLAVGFLFFYGWAGFSLAWSVLIPIATVYSHALMFGFPDRGYLKRGGRHGRYG
jgi:hypothetical protein